MKYTLIIIGIIVGIALSAIGYLLIFDNVADDKDIGVEGGGMQADMPSVTMPQKVIVAAENRKALPQAEEKPQAPLAPDFTLPRIGVEDMIKLSDYRGHKPVILDFFATWCHNCQRDMPVLNELYKKYKDRIEVIAIAGIQESESTVAGYIARNNIEVPFVFDKDNTSMRDYRIQFTNTHVLIDRRGSIVETFPLDITEDHFLSLLEEAESEDRNMIKEE